MTPQLDIKQFVIDKLTEYSKYESNTPQMKKLIDDIISDIDHYTLQELAVKLLELSKIYHNSSKHHLELAEKSLGDQSALEKLS